MIFVVANNKSLVKKWVDGLVSAGVQKTRISADIARQGPEIADTILIRRMSSVGAKGEDVFAVFTNDKFVRAFALTNPCRVFFVGTKMVVNLTQHKGTAVKLSNPGDFKAINEK